MRQQNMERQKGRQGEQLSKQSNDELQVYYHPGHHYGSRDNLTLNEIGTTVLKYFDHILVAADELAASVQ